jgi:hypothetical protein
MNVARLLPPHPPSWISAILIAAASAVGCATTPIGSDSMERRLAETLDTIQAAEQAGADDIPQAHYHLKLARDGVRAAQRALDYGETEAEAQPLIARVRADADLALAIAAREAAKLVASAVPERSATPVASAKRVRAQKNKEVEP